MAKTNQALLKQAKLETWYAKRLREVSRIVNGLIKQADIEHTGEKGLNRLVQSLFDYSSDIDNWALAVADVVVKRSEANEWEDWESMSLQISKGIKKELRTGAVKETYNALRDMQVMLIKTLPLEASKKAHDMARKTLAEGGTYRDVALQIHERLGSATYANAVRIARTECSRARANFTQSRAQALGSTQYIWRTVKDSSVRSEHAHLEGTVHSWDNPPVCGHGKGGVPLRSHPGAIFNCRCWAECLLPQGIYKT